MAADTKVLTKEAGIVGIADALDMEKREEHAYPSTAEK